MSSMNCDKLVSLDDLKRWTKRALARWRPGSVIGLSGELGSGKTTLVRQVSDALCAARGLERQVVTSPSFVIHQSYAAIELEHFDLYRLEGVGEQILFDIGYFDACSKTRGYQGLCFVEWPEKSTSIQVLSLDYHVRIGLDSDGARRICERDLSA